MRIVSLISSATEIVSSLHCMDSLVGISHECDYPESIKRLPVCSEPRFDVNGKSIEIEQSWDKVPQIFASIGLNKPEFFSALTKMRSGQ